MRNTHFSASSDAPGRCAASPMLQAGSRPPQAQLAGPANTAVGRPLARAYSPRNSPARSQQDPGPQRAGGAGSGHLLTWRSARDGQAEVLAQGAARVVAAEQAAVLQARDDV